MGKVLFLFDLIEFDDVWEFSHAKFIFFEYGKLSHCTLKNFYEDD